MRVYSRIVVSMATGETVEEEWTEHEGPVAVCKGSGGSTVDPVYNARMAEMYESQQKMGEEYMQFWRQYLAPVEQKQAASDLELEPLRSAVTRGQLEAGRELLPLQTGAEKAALAYGAAKAQAGVDMLPTLSEAAKRYATTALQGVYNPEEEARVAGAEVANAMGAAKGAALRDVMRTGVATPGRLDAAVRGYALETAKGMAGARTGARRAAKTQNMQALADAVRSGASIMGG